MIYFTYNKNQPHRLFPNTRELFSKILDTKNLSVRITNIFKAVVLFIFEIIELLRNKLYRKDIRPKNSIVSRLNLFVKSNKSTIIKTAIITTTIAVAYCLGKRFSPNLRLTPLPIKHVPNSSESEVLKDICSGKRFSPNLRLAPPIKNVPNSSESEVLKDICLRQDFVKLPFESSIYSLQIDFAAIDSVKNFDYNFIKGLLMIKTSFPNKWKEILAEFAYNLLDRASNVNETLIKKISTIKNLLPNLTNSSTYENKLKALTFRIIDNVKNFDSDLIKRISMIEKIYPNNKMMLILPDHFKKHIRKKLFEAKSIDNSLIKFISEVRSVVPEEFLNNALISFAWVKVIENIKSPNFSEIKSKLQTLKTFLTISKFNSIDTIIQEASLKYELGFPLPSVEEIKDEEYFFSEKDEKSKEFIKAHTLFDTQRILNEKLNPKNAIDALKILGLYIQRNIPDLFSKVKKSAKSNFRKISAKTHPDIVGESLLPVFIKARDASETIVNCLKDERFTEYECFKAYL